MELLQLWPSEDTSQNGDDHNGLCLQMWDDEYNGERSWKRQRFTRDEGCSEKQKGTQLSDLPSPIMCTIFSLVSDVRTRNCISLVSCEWHQMERATRERLSLRGNTSDLHMLPSTFQSVRYLDLSNCSPWGTTVYQSHAAVCSQLTAQWLRQAFPSVVDLTVYVRDVVDIEMIIESWPELQSLKLVRWHQRPVTSEDAAPEPELSTLLNRSSSLIRLDLSRFYCWAEDVIPAIESGRWSSNLRVLNLLKPSPEGLKSQDLVSVLSSCRQLEEFYSLCEFDPRFPDCIGDDCLSSCVGWCANLTTLHLVDSSQFSSRRSTEEEELLDANITAKGLETVFQSLPKLKDLALLLGQNVRDSAPAFESLARNCKDIQSVRVSHFHGLCNGPQLDGIAKCAGLRELFIKSCEDLSDLGLRLVSMGCSGLVKLGLQGCALVSEHGISECVTLLRRSLVHVKIESCVLLSSTASVLRSLLPVRRIIRHLQLECKWEAVEEDANDYASLTDQLGPVSWDRLEHLSLWVAAGELISPLFTLGLLESCPALRHLEVQVEGDSRLFPKPQAREFGLGHFARFGSIRSLKLDLSEVVGYVFSAPGGYRDLSIWERFYLQGIQDLRGLEEFDYFPPSDKDVNYRGMTLPGAGLISQCTGLRKLFIHGTTYEHLSMMLLKIPNLRDFQLRADYFPTPDMHTCTEMRAESCRRFENLLAKRGFPD